MTHRVTRRAFVAYSAATCGALVAMPIALRAAAVPAATAQAFVPAKRPFGPVLSFHLDQPYLDYSGTAVPYVPVNGVRAGAGIAELSEQELRSRICYL